MHLFASSGKTAMQRLHPVATVKVTVCSRPHRRRLVALSRVRALKLGA